MSMSISSSNSSSSSNGNNNDDLSPPFARNVHIMSATIDEDVRKQVDELRAILASSASPSSPSEEAIYRQYEDWCTDEQLHRFLIARQYHVRNAFEMIIAALKWRLKRIPAVVVDEYDGLDTDGLRALLEENITSYQLNQHRKAERDSKKNRQRKQAQGKLKQSVPESTFVMTPLHYC
jgi:hypothetical protein